MHADADLHAHESTSDVGRRVPVCVVAVLQCLNVVLPDLNFRGGIRFGKLLEDIDAFAGNVAFLHCNDGDPNTKVPVLVTACLDRLDIDFPVTLNLGTDLQLQGQVTWTSKSALQISIHLYPKDSQPSPDKQLTVM
jgi:hypothetical protein